MATVYLYLDKGSQPCRTVLQFLILNNIPHQLIQIDLMSGDQRKPPFSEKFKASTLPAIEHGPLCLQESGAIITYLAQAFNVSSQWWPADIYIRAKIQEYFHQHHANIRGKITPYLWNVLIKPRIFGGECPAEQAEQYKATMESAFETLNSYFEHHMNLLEQREPTVADLACFNEVDQMFMTGYNMNRYMYLMSWRGRLNAIEEVGNTREKAEKILSA